MSVRATAGEAYPGVKQCLALFHPVVGIIRGRMDAVTVTSDNGPDLRNLLACEPLREALGRIVVVNNLSSDGSAAIAREGGAVLVERESRGGYGACVNTGVPHTGGEAFVVMNPDILLDDAGAVERLSRHLEDPRVAIVVPALRLPDGRLQDSVRHVPTPFDLLTRRLRGTESGVIREGGEVPWAVAAFYLVRRSAFEAMGGFDERYFLYFEDVDLCERLRRAGWKIRFDPDVVVRHEFAAASRRGLLAPATRHHMRSAAKFFLRFPRYLVSRRTP